VQENGAATTVNEARDAFVEKGDFVRFRELSLSYTLPAAGFLRRAGVDGGTVGLAFQNLALWTDYQGADPEVVSATQNNGAGQFSRSDFLTLPNPKRTLLRVNLSF
jgi:hypothetical protein